MDIIEKMRCQEKFTTSELEIIKLLLNDPNILLSSPTAAQLGVAAYTSASTVVRLCQKLDCKNFAEFKTQFISDYQQREQTNLYVDADLPFTAADSPETVLDQLTALEEIAIRLTRSIISPKDYQAAAKILNEAACIDVYGEGGNVNLLHDFAYKMGRIHHQVHIHQDNQQQMLSASIKHTDHCAIVISYSGETPSILRYSKLLKSNNVPTLSITSQGTNSLASITDINLNMATLESKPCANVKLGTFTSSISIITIMNYLYAGVFQLDYETHYEHLNEDLLIFLKDR